jgi:hypothetical protein
MSNVGFSTRGRGDHSSLNKSFLPQPKSTKTDQTNYGKSILDPPPLPKLPPTFLKICNKKDNPKNPSNAKIVSIQTNTVKNLVPQSSPIAHINKQQFEGKTNLSKTDSSSIITSQNDIFKDKIYKGNYFIQQANNIQGMVCTFLHTYVTLYFHLYKNCISLLDPKVKRIITNTTKSCMIYSIK